VRGAGSPTRGRNEGMVRCRIPGREGVTMTRTPTEKKSRVHVEKEKFMREEDWKETKGFGSSVKK